MKFRTILPPISTNRKIGLAEPILTIGSCFADSIGGKLAANKFKVLTNPFGTIFDPLSISRLLTHSINQTEIDNQTFVNHQGVYKSLDLHSSFAAASKAALATKIQAQIAEVHNFLRSAKWLLITFGTAYAYKYRHTGNYIANCQKLPAGEFQRQLLTADQLADDFRTLLSQLQLFNPDIQLVVTVSPVRHLKDGLAENSLSKATLRTLCHELTQTNDSITYYPAFELMLDDLRDYRFYQEDMLHPTDQAIDYIWQHFSQSFFADETMGFLRQWQKIRAALQHKPFNPRSPAHQQFLQNTLQELRQIGEIVDVTAEISRVQNQIAS